MHWLELALAILSAVGLGVVGAFGLIKLMFPLTDAGPADDDVLDELEQGSLIVLGRHRIKEAAMVTAQAFADSPPYRFVFPGLSRELRVEALAWMFEANYVILRSLSPTSMLGVLSDDDPGQLVCFFMLRPSSAKVSFPRMVSAGLLEVPFRFGWESFRNLLHASEVAEKFTKAIVPAKYGGKYLTLERMVVLPEFQGRGIGSAGLSSAVRRVLALGLPVVLNTQEKINVKFYEKNGFKVVDEMDAYGCHHWGLIQEPLRPMGK
jgi:GNAT superfamily N-acetyltransferase